MIPHTDRLTPEREAEIREHLASTDNHTLSNLAARDLLAELAAVRAERDDVEAEREKLVRWHLEDGKSLAKALAHVAELKENLRAVNAGWDAARTERDRYRLAWQSARQRAQAYGEGILRVVKDREAWQGWCKTAEARVAELEEQAKTARTETIADVGDFLDEHDQKDAAYLVYTVDIPAARDMKTVAVSEAGESR
ncbi:hypothetical protein [Streptomyces sp. NPDC003720]|uniref:hypothetical protein n=1 Tax=Streptomyces sp. NPDC003720 TaxID=3364684 RepID=UPI0036A61ADA